MRRVDLDPRRRDNVGVSRRLDTQFEFLTHYEVLQLDRIDRSDGKRAFDYPDAVPLDPQQELADRPILEVPLGRSARHLG